MNETRVIVIVGNPEKRKLVEKYLLADFNTAGITAKLGIHNDCEYSVVGIDSPSELEMYAKYSAVVFNLLGDDVRFALPTVQINSTYADNRMKVAVRRGIECITTLGW